ncbi:MAG: helix-turn-helix domain-containing protein [Phycisphaeraceae bacterium]|nr:helix-turn-helix domain-containing protein [Phycisphaeraceae bacterium]
MLNRTQNTGLLFRTSGAEIRGNSADSRAEFIVAPPSNGTQTSDDAAKSLNVKALATMRAAILRLLRETPGGLTREEIEQRTGLPGNTVRPRVRELFLAGMVREDGERETESGRKAAIVKVAGGEG